MTIYCMVFFSYPLFFVVTLVFAFCIFLTKCNYEENHVLEGGRVVFFVWSDAALLMIFFPYFLSTCVQTSPWVVFSFLNCLFMAFCLRILSFLKRFRFVYCLYFLFTPRCVSVYFVLQRCAYLCFFFFGLKKYSPPFFVEVSQIWCKNIYCKRFFTTMLFLQINSKNIMVESTIFCPHSKSF